MSLGTKLLLSRLTLIGSVLAFGHLDMLSFFSLCLCVGVDNALIKGEIANTFSVVFSFCDEALPTTTFSFYFLFLLYLLRLCVTGTLRCVERRVPWFVLCRCRAADPEADGEVKTKWGLAVPSTGGCGERANVVTCRADGPRR
jgi:hypothetical protein